MKWFKRIYYNLIYGKIEYSALKHNGKVYTGRNHAECFLQEPKGVLRNAEQGFVTTKGRFVERKKALKIAKFYNQVKHKHCPEDRLLSEDMI